FQQVFVVPAFPGNADVIYDHRLDAMFSAFRLHEVASEFRSNHLRNMLVFADRQNFLFRQARQLDTVIDRQHDGSRYSGQLVRTASCRSLYRKSNYKILIWVNRAPLGSGGERKSWPQINM